MLDSSELGWITETNIVFRYLIHFLLVLWDDSENYRSSTDILFAHYGMCFWWIEFWGYQDVQRQSSQNDLLLVLLLRNKPRRQHYLKRQSALLVAGLVILFKIAGPNIQSMSCTTNRLSSPFRFIHSLVDLVAFQAKRNNLLLASLTSMQRDTLTWNNTTVCAQKKISVGSG